MKVVAVPTSNEEKQKELRQWDLWGPFIVCLLLGIILSITSKKSSGLVFSTIFIIIWIGGIIITINSSLLGGKLSLLQCICLLGYCSFPCVVSALLIRVILKFLPGIGKLVIVIISFYWSIKGNFFIFFYIFSLTNLYIKLYIHNYKIKMVSKVEERITIIKFLLKER
jgi:hypothetical protein